MTDTLRKEKKLYRLNDKKTFRKLVDGTVVEMEGIVVGRTHEEKPRYDFKVGDNVVLNIPEEDVVTEVEGS